MGKVVLDITMSLDGFVTAPHDGRDRGLGDDGEVLHYWVFGGPWTYGNEDPTSGGATGVDKEVLDELMQSAAAVVGPRTYDVTDGWGGKSPFGVPCIVVTHRVSDQPDPASGFEFVEGVAEAVDRARQIAGDGDVGIGGGARHRPTGPAGRAGRRAADPRRADHPGRGPHPLRRARHPVAARARPRPRLALRDAHQVPGRDLSHDHPGGSLN